MDDFLKDLPNLAKDKLKENEKFFAKLKKRTPKNLDAIVEKLHDEEFERTDCLTCANCCKTTSPIFLDKDIQRISKHLKMKEQQFIEQYLVLDTDDFFMLKTAPCPFLDETDNKCFIYEVRPKACKEYPHTNRRKFIQIAKLTIKNTEICPATFHIVEALKKELPV